jgi:AcrR family transcriptional regulator
MSREQHTPRTDVQPSPRDGREADRRNGSSSNGSTRNFTLKFRLELPYDAPARERLKLAARELIRERGYESLEVREIAAAAGVSRQTFYNNFADKRECVAAVAGDPEIADIDLRLRAAEARGSEWAPQLGKALEGALAEEHASPDTPRARLLDALEGSIEERGYAETRLVHLTKAAGVSRKDFYVQFADKQECLAALCGRAVGEFELALEDELCDREAVELELALALLVDALTADPRRTRIAVGQLPELSWERPADPRLAHARSFRDLLEALAARDPQLASEELGRRIVVGALADAIEGAVDSGRQDEIPALVSEVCEALLLPLRPTASSQAQAGTPRAHVALVPTSPEPAPLTGAPT